MIADIGTHKSLMDRSAVRFLLGHRQGRLLTGDHVTGETWVSLVDYRFGRDGALVVELPSEGEQADAIRQGGYSVLNVTAEPEHLHGDVVDEHGLLTAHAIAHLSARVEAVIENDDAQTMVVRLHVQDVEVYLRREHM